jgi:hypothetical protein
MLMVVSCRVVRQLASWQGHRRRLPLSALTAFRRLRPAELPFARGIAMFCKAALAIAALRHAMHRGKLTEFSRNLHKVQVLRCGILFSISGVSCGIFSHDKIKTLNPDVKQKAAPELFCWRVRMAGRQMFWAWPESIPPCFYKGQYLVGVK